MALHTRPLRLLLALFLLGLGGGNALPAQETADIASGPDCINVRVCGAVGDGKSDDTVAFERALDQGREQKRPVYVPRGQYLITRTLRLRDQLLTGGVAGGWPADSIPMATLLIGHVTGPGVAMEDFASLHGVALLYPGGIEFPEAGGPPAVSLEGQGPTISGVRIQYPYDGIITAPGAHPGRARLADIFIVSPRHDGVYLTKSYDVSQLRNIEVWCNVGMSSGAGFRFGRNDDCQCSDLFAFQCGTAYLFETDEAEGGGVFYGSLTDCSSDACSRGWVVGGDHRINLANSNLVDHHDSLVVDGERASVRMTGCLVQSNGAPAVRVVRCANLTIADTLFTRAFAADFYFIEAQSCGSLTVTGCQFKAFSPGVLLGEGVGRAVVVNNIFEAAGPAITDHTPASAAKVLGPNIAAP